MPSHRTHRAEIELQVDTAELGRRLHARLGALHREQLLPVLDRVCSEFSGAAQIDRIETLELDLGEIALEQLDRDFAPRLEMALREALGTRLGAQRSERPRHGAAAELLETFLLTGNLPWWADRGASELLPQALRELLGQAPARLRQIVASVAADDAAIDRLARICADEVFPAAMAVIDGPLTAADLAVLATPAADPPAAELRIDAHAWRARLLRWQLGHAEPSGTDVHQAIVEAIPVAALAALAERVQGTTWQRTSAALREAVAVRLAGRSTASMPPLPSGPAAPPAPAHRGPLGLPPQADHGLPATAEAVREIGYGARRVHLDAEPRAPRAEPAADPASQRDRPGPASAAGGHGAMHGKPAGAHAPHASLADPALAAQSAKTRVEALRRHAMARLDELRVEDAGLVILWPFIERGFERAGLLDAERRFADADARRQAVGLLSWIVFEDDAAPEHRLPLAKLLCGLAPDEPCFVDEAPQPSLQQVGLQMMQALVEHAPSLRRPPLAALRAHYLRRAGLLGVRTGTWLLQAERQPQDLLLDRCPWSWAWVRLPWMQAPLQVAW